MSRLNEIKVQLLRLQPGQEMQIDNQMLWRAQEEDWDESLRSYFYFEPVEPNPYHEPLRLGEWCMAHNIDVDNPRGKFYTVFTRR